jgi:basic membrane protein A
MKLNKVLVLALAAGATLAAVAEPAIVYDMGGKFDKSFNEAAYRGAEMWKKESGKPYLDFEIANEAQREQAMRRMAARGANPVIGIGFSQGSSLEKVAKEFPKLNFAIIDSVVKLPNVESIVFKEHEGSFLVGMMAALASKSGKVGFVGGMDIPLIRKFQCGYEQGAKYANPKVEVSSVMTGTTPAAWSDPTRGSELAKAQFAKGVDVVFAAAGGTGSGVYQAAKQPEPHAAGHHADLDGQARRRGGAQRCEEADPRGHLAGSEGRRRRLRPGRAQRQAGERRHEGQGRCGQSRHHRGQDQGGRLHGR